MGFVLGFGDTESRFEVQLEESIRQLITERYSATDLLYFSDEFSDGVATSLQEMSSDSQKVGEQYKKAAAYPDRYAYFWVSVVSDASHLVVILKIHHINRRHAMSPDGWGMMRTERMFYITPSEAQVLRKSAA